MEVRAVLLGCVGGGAGRTVMVTSVPRSTRAANVSPESLPMNTEMTSGAEEVNLSM